MLRPGQATRYSPPARATFVDKQKLPRWFGTYRGRIGYSVWDPLAAYFTGGLTYGGRKTSGAVTGALGGPYSADDTVTGWVVSVSVDFAITPAWTARLEISPRLAGRLHAEPRVWWRHRRP